MAFARAIGEYGSVVFIAGNMPMRTEITPLLIITKLINMTIRGDRHCGRYAVSFYGLVAADQSATKMEQSAPGTGGTCRRGI